MLYNLCKVGGYVNYEVKTVVKEENMEDILYYFDMKSSKKDFERQVIYNYHTEGEFRLIRSNNYSKLNFRDNDSDDNVYISKKYEKDLIDMFKNIGISVDFKRFRERYKYIYDVFYITIDKNIKTGNILRVKFNYTSESDKEVKLNKIKNLFNELEIEETNLEKFEEIYGKYRTSWNDLVGDIDDEDFLK